MRKCEYKERNSKTGEFETYIGTFLTWSIMDKFEGFHSPAAIIEKEDGQVTVIWAEKIKFLDHDSSNDELLNVLIKISKCRIGHDLPEEIITEICDLIAKYCKHEFEKDYPYFCIKCHMAIEKE